MGPLTENHRCPSGAFSRVMQALSTVLIGGVIGSVLVYGLVERPAAALLVASAALGAVIANAVRQSVKF
jgi:hypothetical protein